jgi:hypothetical protein
MKIKGIYKIINKINGKYYVGSSDNIKRRWYNHKIELNKNQHNNKYLQRAWNKYGENNFDFIIVESVNDDDLLNIEQKYLNIINNNRNISYNISTDSKSPMKGNHHSEESKEKIRICSTGRKHSLQSKLKISMSKKGIKNPKLGRNMSEKNNPMYGKHHSNESKEKSRISHLGKYDGIKNPNYGKKHSYITKQKISEALKGKPSPFKGKSCISSRKSNIFNFKNKKTGEIFIGTRYDFKEKYSLKGVYGLIGKKVKSYKGWILQ